MHFAGTLLSSRPNTTLSGTLNATAVAGTATSATVTVRVPPGNSGQIKFEVVADAGTINNSLTSKNGAAFASVGDPETITYANGDTLAYRTTGNTAGESRTFRLTDVDTNRIIGAYVHTGA